MNKRNQHMQSDRYSLLDCEIRPVNKNDKWCYHSEIPAEGEAPWGYVITIPYVPNVNTVLDHVDGHIIRCKKHCGKLFLQVVKKEFAPKYGVKSFERPYGTISVCKGKRSGKKHNRILNIRNFNKSENKW